MSEMTLDALATEIRARMDGFDTRVDDKVGEVLTDERLREAVRANLETLLADDKFGADVRKVRFGQPQTELVGTKYARLGMDAADVELLHDILQAGQDAGLSKRGPTEELTRTFEAISAGRYVSTALARADDERRLGDLRRAGRLDTLAYERALRAMDTAESGFGAQLIGAQYVGDMWEAARAQSLVFNLLDSFEMTDATAYLPVEVDIPEMLFVAENSSPTASDYTTSKTGSQRVQVTPSKQIIHQIYSGEMEEDAIVPWLPFLRRQAGLSLAHYSDSLVLNGDTTNAATGNINLDDADPADSKHYLAFDGIRHAAIVDNTGNASDAAGVITLAKLNAMRGLMVDATNLHDWGHPTMEDDLVYVSETATADSICMIDEVLTRDKYGDFATVLNGEVSKILGHPHIRSMAVKKTEADGKVSTTANNNTKGQVVAFNRRAYKVGWRRRVQLEVERLPGRDQSRLIWSLRLGFGRFTPTGAASGIESASVLYNASL